LLLFTKYLEKKHYYRTDDKILRQDLILHLYKFFMSIVQHLVSNMAKWLLFYLSFAVNLEGIQNKWYNFLWCVFKRIYLYEFLRNFLFLCVMYQFISDFLVDLDAYICGWIFMPKKVNLFQGCKNFSCISIYRHSLLHIIIFSLKYLSIILCTKEVRSITML
jgi:hypothetical protein